MLFKFTYIRQTGYRLSNTFFITKAKQHWDYYLKNIYFINIASFYAKKEAFYSKPA